MNHVTGALRALATASLVIATALVPATPATAATSAGWADWDPLAGSAGDWSTTMRLPAAGFPAADVTSDSRGGVGVVSGASSWLSDATPPGAVYGSSRNQQYLNLRPQADTSTAPSTTTYTFERPTPAGGWAFVLGDIDADRAVVSAVGEDGQPLSPGQLGWQGSFNYCQGAGSPSCTGTDEPTWDPATAELLGNDAAADTNGASGWFQPTVAVTSLTIEFSQRSGFPVYQTWFASLARDISGTVTVVDEAGTPQGPLAEATLTLFGPDGTELATTTSAEDGTYAFEGYTAAPGYRVEMTTLPPASDEHPFGLVARGPDQVDEIDLTDTDADGVDFAARDIVPVAVSGTVLDDGGAPVAGATVTLTPVGGGEPLTAVTGARGQYVIDGVAWDTAGNQPQEYQFALSDLPEGYSTVTAPDDISVEVGQEDASPGNDFVVRAPAREGRVAGTVTDDEGGPVPDATVTLDGPGGPVEVTTDEEGAYLVGGLSAGDYTITLTVPDGYTAQTTERSVTITSAGESHLEEDFVLTGVPVDPVPADPQLYQASGGVADTDGEPVAGAVVTVADADGTTVTTITTSEDGTWATDLAANRYAATVAPPDGYVIEGEPILSFEVVDQDVDGLDFTLTTRAATPDPSPRPSGATGPDAGDPGDGDLAATGAAVGAAALSAAALLSLGGVLIWVARRSRSDSGTAA